MGKVSQKTRKKTATVVQGRGAKKQYRFPMPDKEHARKALQMLPRAKGLSAEEKSKIRARANRKLYGAATPSKAKKANPSKKRR